MKSRDNSRFYRHLLAGSCLAAMAVLAQPA